MVIRAPSPIGVIEAPAGQELLGGIPGRLPARPPRQARLSLGAGPPTPAGWSIRPDVLVQPEQVGRIELAFECLEPNVFGHPVRLSDSLLSFLHQEVDVDAGVIGGEGRRSSRRVTADREARGVPGSPVTCGRCTRWLRPRLRALRFQAAGNPETPRGLCRRLLARNSLAAPLIACMLVLPVTPVSAFVLSAGPCRSVSLAGCSGSGGRGWSDRTCV